MRTSYARRPPAGDVARRLPRDPQGRPLPGVPACRVQRDDGLARRARRAGRDLERHAVLLAAVGAHRARHVAAPRARRDVGDDAAAAPRRASATSSSPTVAPPLYRRTPIVTLSESSQARAGRTTSASSAERVTVVPPGIDPRFSPGGAKSPTPLVVAVGRLVPVKRFDVLIDALVALQGRHPGARGGDRRRGLRPRSARGADPRRAAPSAGSACPGRIDDDELVDLYRRAWVLASASAHEGWGMTITEAAACGTPGGRERVAGHADAVVDGRHRAPRRRRRRAARRARPGPARRRPAHAHRAHARPAHAARFTWAATARGTLEVLAAAAIARRRRHGDR